MRFFIKKEYFVADSLKLKKIAKKRGFETVLSYLEALLL
jgi:hypothetical protein